MKPKKKPLRPIVSLGMLREQEQWALDEVREKTAELRLWQAAIGYAQSMRTRAQRRLRAARENVRSTRRSIHQLDARKGT